MKQNIKREYVTRETGAGGYDYRTIADIMTASGDSMRHSTVRNCINRSMERWAASLMAINGVAGDPAEVARSAAFHRCIEEIVIDLYSDTQHEIEQLKQGQQ